MNEKHIMLGATLYIPCTRNDLIEIAKGQKLSNIKSLVFCTEDSVATKDLNLALHNLKNALLSIQKNKNYKFIRIRNLQIFEEILKLTKIINIATITIRTIHIIFILNLKIWSTILDSNQ